MNITGNEQVTNSTNNSEKVENKENEITYEKVGVFEIFRHGARTPKGLDKITSKLIYGTEKMQLTQNGFRQHYVLGKILRLFKYKNLLNKSNLVKNILISPKERCIYSAVAQVNGLFPNENIVFENLNESVDLRNDDFPPGYQEYLNLPSTVTAKNKRLKVISKLNKLKNKKDDSEISEIGNQSDLELNSHVKLKIVDPYKNIYFHPDKCVFYRHQKLVVSKNDTNTEDTSKIQPENDDQSSTELNRKKSFNFKEIDDMEEDIDDIPSEYSVMKPSVNFIQKKIKKFRKRDEKIETKELKTTKEESPKSEKKTSESEETEKDIFEITDEMIKNAVDSIEKSLISAFKEKIKEDEWVLNKNDEKHSYKHLGKLVHFIVPLRYHFNNETGKRLTFNKDVEKTIKMVMINHFYSKKLNDSIEKRLLFTELMRDIISNMRLLIENKNYSLNLYSGHDTTLVNMIVNLFDVNKIKSLLQKSIDKNDDLYNSFIPPFASNIILEVVKQTTRENSKYYVKMYYNNKERKDNWISGIDYTDNGIDLNQFIKVFENLLVNTSNGNWECEDDI